MCWEDLKIARNTWTQITLVTGQAAPFVIVPYNNLRIGLEISTPHTGTVRVAPDQPTITVNLGYLLSAALGNWLVRDIYQHGDIVRRPWWGFGSAANVMVVTETFVTDDPAQLKEYRSDS